jgi:hypothetical protein
VLLPIAGERKEKKEVKKELGKSEKQKCRLFIGIFQTPPDTYHGPFSHDSFCMFHKLMGILLGIKGNRYGIDKLELLSYVMADVLGGKIIVERMATAHERVGFVVRFGRSFEFDNVCIFDPRGGLVGCCPHQDPF